MRGGCLGWGFSQGDGAGHTGASWWLEKALVVCSCLVCGGKGSPYTQHQRGVCLEPASGLSVGNVEITDRLPTVSVSMSWAAQKRNWLQ